MQRNAQFLVCRIREINNEITPPNNRLNIILFLNFINDYAKTLKSSMQHEYFKKITSKSDIFKSLQFGLTISDSKIELFCIKMLKDIVDFSPSILYSYISDNFAVRQMSHDHNFSTVSRLIISVFIGSTPDQPRH